MPACRHCREDVPVTFDLCWNCGVPLDGPYDPADFSAWSYEDKVAQKQDAQAFVVSPGTFRFRLIHLLALTTLVAIGAAVLRSGDVLFMLGAVLITNLIGVLVGIFVTSIWGLPNDGSDRNYRDDDAK